MDADKCDLCFPFTEWAPFSNGVDPVTIETNIPALMPAPQAPQKPQAPPGTDLPRLFISISDFFRSMSPPEFLYAVRSAIPTIM